MVLPCFSFHFSDYCEVEHLSVSLLGLRISSVNGLLNKF